MKKLIISLLTLGVIAGLAPRAQAGDREWATAGKVLTGVIAGAALVQALQPPPAPVYTAPPVAYVPAPAPPPVVYAPAPMVVAGPPVVYAPPPVYYALAPVVGFHFRVGHAPRHHRGHFRR